ncbi:MAG: hypothetical protein ACMVO3_23045 [Thalassobaculum sp.]
MLTTPESLALLLSYPDAGEIFAGLRCVVVDELHALAGTKRGELLALALARLAVPGARGAAGRAVGHRRPPGGAGGVSVEDRPGAGAGRDRGARRRGGAGRGEDPAAGRGQRRGPPALVRAYGRSTPSTGSTPRSGRTGPRWSSSTPAPRPS